MNSEAELSLGHKNKLTTGKQLKNNSDYSSTVFGQKNLKSWNFLFKLNNYNPGIST